jgi:hypothetical protein
MVTVRERPRRDAVRAIVGTGLAMLGLSQAGPTRAAKRNPWKTKPGATPPPKLKLLPSDEAEFSVDPGGVNAANAQCAAGSFVVSGIYTMTNPKCAPVIVGFVFSTAAGTSGWQLTVQCPPGESSKNNTVQALCLVGAKLAT